MKFGEKYTKKCVTCGNEFEGYTSSKYCSDACKPQNRVHRKKVKEEVKQDDGNNISIVDSGGLHDNGTDRNDAERNETNVSESTMDEQLRNKTKNEMNSIQIIDSNTGKKEKGIVDQIFEKLFSEEMAPVTTAILGGIATRLQQPNNDVDDGMLTAEDGSKHVRI